ncbi:MAG TPA: deoxyribodipyrimidine photo-lyase [Propionibacteriaceae bacterium]|nr:deoxyribodipyrimidine photo-lyase [Propionibacteriaceae bacterium]
MHSGGQAAIWWVRRDLRLADNPALRSAIDDGEAVLPVFVLDPTLMASAGQPRRAWLIAALHILDRDLRDIGGHGLSIARGDPAAVVPRLAKAHDAQRVHVTADFSPYGRSRDNRVAHALGVYDIELSRTGSPYAVAPGTLQSGSGRPFQLFSPFHRAWMAHGVPEPAPAIRASEVQWLLADDQVRLEDPDEDLLPLVGEMPSRMTWQAWLSGESKGLADYDKLHGFPGADATSHLSIALRWGHLHPRTVLHDLARIRSNSAATLARQIAWRDFFADVLFHRPEAVREPIRHEFSNLPTDDPDRAETAAKRLKAWQEGRTGYPLVDAGMRQLLAQGWMHNRVRMVVASFLTKDLHIGWWHGANWFMEHLRDGDIAQNQLNWQWVAGCGTDAAPYFRIFNPTAQSEKFDADGSYIRRYVPELAEMPIEHLHKPWTAPGGVPKGYPEPIVVHAVERKEALDRYAVVRGL